MGRPKVDSKPTVKVSDVILTTSKIDEIMNKQAKGIQLIRSERIWLSNMVGVRKANLVFSMSESEIIEFAKCKMSVHYFAQKYCCIKREDGSIGPMILRDYQKEIIKLFDENRFSILMASRQVGKTVSASIYILWFMTFHNDKICMVIANKGKTVKEIVEKIKSIYKNLPFFLKAGVVNWNQSTIAFENGSSLKSENRTTDPGIGNTISLLYFDEFAKVQDNIIRVYYGTAIPIISSMHNSKIIITSTPDGFNLFHELVEKAKLDHDDPNWNGYSFMKVYWTQVKGYLDTKFIPLENKLRRYSMKTKELLEQIAYQTGCEVHEKTEDNKTIYYIDFDQNNEKTSIEYAKKLRINGLSILDLCHITNFKQEQIKLLNDDENMFKQEFDIEFISGDKMLFDDSDMKALEKSSTPIKHINIPIFDKKMILPYTGLQWIQDHNLFNLNDAKNYYIIAGIDVGEGLKQDYSVINLFRLRLKTPDDILQIKSIQDNIYDYVYLEQIGLFRSNVYSPKDLAHIFYLIFYELFDPEKCKVVLELNGPGAEMKAFLASVFNGQNNYGGDSIFVRYLQGNNWRAGLKMTNEKNTFVKAYQDAMRQKKILIHDPFTLSEIKTFIRHDKANGDFTYKASNGHDDCVMSLVNLCTIFEQTAYKNQVLSFLDKGLNKVEQDIIDPEKDNILGSYTNSDISMISRARQNVRVLKGINPKTNPQIAVQKMYELYTKKRF